MDKASVNRLYSITKKELRELTKEDISFLRARRSYLIDREVTKFASVLEDKKEVKEETKIKVTKKTK